jgi:hypothetical protein
VEKTTSWVGASGLLLQHGTAEAEAEAEAWSLEQHEEEAEPGALEQQELALRAAAE